MTAAARFRFLGTYTASRLRVGDRATCLYRDTDVLITSWSDARISWPRCRALDHKGGSGLLVDETKHAIATESGEALEYPFGVTHNTVCKWRRTFEIGRHGTPGSKRAYKAIADALGNQLREKRPTARTLRKMRAAAVERDAAEPLREYAEQNGRP